MVFVTFTTFTNSANLTINNIVLNKNLYNSLPNPFIYFTNNYYQVLSLFKNFRELYKTIGNLNNLLIKEDLEGIKKECDTFQIIDFNTMSIENIQPSIVAIPVNINNKNKILYQYVYLTIEGVISLKLWEQNERRSKLMKMYKIYSNEDDYYTTLAMENDKPINLNEHRVFSIDFIKDTDDDIENFLNNEEELDVTDLTIDDLPYYEKYSYGPLTPIEAC